MEEEAKILSPLQPPMYYRDFTFVIGGFLFLLLLHFLPWRGYFYFLGEFDLVDVLAIEGFNTAGNVAVFLVASFFTGLFLSVLGKICFELGVRMCAPFKKRKKQKNFKDIFKKRDQKYQKIRIQRLKYLEKHPLVQQEYHRIIYQGLTFRILFAQALFFSIMISFWFMIPMILFLALLVKVDQGIEVIREGIAGDS